MPHAPPPGAGAEFLPTAYERRDVAHLLASKLSPELQARIDQIKETVDSCMYSNGEIEKPVPWTHFILSAPPSKAAHEAFAPVTDLVVWAPETLFNRAGLQFMPCPCCGNVGNNVITNGWGESPCLLVKYQDKLLCLLSKEYVCSRCDTVFRGWNPDAISHMPLRLANLFPVPRSALSEEAERALCAVEREPPQDGPAMFGRSTSLSSLALLRVGGDSDSEFLDTFSDFGMLEELEQSDNAGAAPQYSAVFEGSSSSSSSSSAQFPYGEPLASLGGSAARADQEPFGSFPELRNFEEFVVPAPQATTSMQRNLEFHRRRQQEQLQQNHNRSVPALPFKAETPQQQFYVLGEGRQGYGAAQQIVAPSSSSSAPAAQRPQDGVRLERRVSDKSTESRTPSLAGSLDLIPEVARAALLEDVGEDVADTSMAAASLSESKRSIQFCSVCFGVRRQRGQLVGGHKPNGFCPAKGRKATADEKRELRRRRQKMRRAMNKRRGSTE